MWKWIGGCLGLIVLLIVGSFWWGYQTMKSSLSDDGTARVTINGSPSRVFASLADGDSIPSWMAQGNTVRTARHGRFVPGDTIHIEMRQRIGALQQRLSWKVAEVVPDQLLVLQLVTDTSARIIALRRDSLAAQGDSTVVVSTLVSPMIDSVRASQTASKGKQPGGVVGLTSDLLLSLFRMQSKLELDRLKARIEGAPAGVPAAPPKR